MAPDPASRIRAPRTRPSRRAQRHCHRRGQRFARPRCVHSLGRAGPAWEADRGDGATDRRHRRDPPSVGGIAATAGDLWTFSAGAGRAATRRSGTPPRRFRKCRLLRGLYRHTKAGSPRQAHSSSLQTGRRQPQISMRHNGRTGVAPWSGGNSRPLLRRRYCTQRNSLRTYSRARSRPAPSQVPPLTRHGHNAVHRPGLRGQ